jgi:hypothetical protein
MNDQRGKSAQKSREPNATKAKDLKKVKRLGEQDVADDTMEGEASPGLTIGGGGHA